MLGNPLEIQQSPKTFMATLALAQRLFTELTTRPAHYWPATVPSSDRYFRQHCQTFARLTVAGRVA